MKRGTRIARIALVRVAATCAVIAGTTSACEHAPYLSVQQLPKDVLAPKPGLIAPGDVVEMRVFGQDALSTKAIVREDGLLTLPLVGAVKAAGQTPAELAAQTKERLKPFVTSPEVTVSIQESLVSVAIVGQVRTAGVMQLESPATVLHALAKAGGMTEFADDDGIYVLRKLSGVVQRVRFHYDSLVAAEPAAIGFQLRTGDVVVVE